jgi:hypothetical protein
MPVCALISLRSWQDRNDDRSRIDQGTVTAAQRTQKPEASFSVSPSLPGHRRFRRTDARLELLAPERPAPRRGEADGAKKLIGAPSFRMIKRRVDEF